MPWAVFQLYQNRSLFANQFGVIRVEYTSWPTRFWEKREASS